MFPLKNAENQNLHISPHSFYASFSVLFGTDGEHSDLARIMPTNSPEDAHVFLGPSFIVWTNPKLNWVDVGIGLSAHWQ